jgi:hypothetical protein
MIRDYSGLRENFVKSWQAFDNYIFTHEKPRSMAGSAGG